MTQTQKPEITSTAIYKILGHDCWMVPSDSSNAMYKVCFDNDAANWTCTCKHGYYQTARGLAAHCKHVAAVEISVRANKKITKPLETSQKGALHSAKAFSLLKK